MTAAAGVVADTGQDPWAQIAGLRPRLHSHLQFCRHTYRDRYWYVATDKLAANHFRCSEVAYDFLVLLDGKHSVEQAFSVVSAQHPDSPLAHDEVIRLLASLQDADLLQGVASAAQAGAESIAPAAKPNPLRQVLLRPLSIKLPLVDPERFLNRLLPLARPAFSKAGFALWALFVGWTALLCLNLWPDLGVHWQSRFLDVTNLLWLWPLYPLVKGLHELGHGFATRVWGGEVHEMGVMLLVFMPVPYVDASASNAFEDKHQRMLVGAAGIMVELFIAALALLAWANLEPGFARDMAFNIAFIGGASTLLFNGNPLLRFDGYYVFADAVEIPNLGTRANQYLGYLLQRYLLRLDGVKSPVSAAGERGWLFGYSIAAGSYRLFITFTIALFVAGKFFVVGLALALWFLVTQLILPVVKIARRLVPLAIMQGRGLRLLTITGGTLALVFTFLFVLPLPHSTHSEGIINLAEDASIRTQADGFIVEVLARNGDVVNAGDPLFQLEDSSIQSRVALFRAKESELQARYDAVMIEDRNAAARFSDEIKSATAQRLDIERQRENLLVRSEVAGRFWVERADDLPGRFVKKGDLLAHVVELSSVKARVVVPQSAVDLVRRQTAGIEVKLYSEPEITLPSTLLREVPSATDQLPSRTLGSQAGGDIAVDARDEQGTRSIDRIFQFDIDLPPKETGPYLGQTLAVRFVHSAETLGIRLMRKLRRAFQKRHINT